MRPQDAAQRLRAIAAGLGNPQELLNLAAELEAVRPGLGAAADAIEPAPQPGPGALGQTFVSAPAAGAIALVMGLAGVGTGYLIRGKLQENKRRGRTSRKLANPSEDEE